MTVKIFKDDKVVKIWVMRGAQVLYFDNRAMVDLQTEDIYSQVPPTLIINEHEFNEVQQCLCNLPFIDDGKFLYPMVTEKRSKPIIPDNGYLQEVPNSGMSAINPENQTELLTPTERIRSNYHPVKEETGQPEIKRPITQGGTMVMPDDPQIPKRE